MLAVGVIIVAFVVTVVVVENRIGGFFERANVTICFDDPDIVLPPPPPGYEEDMFLGNVLFQCPKRMNVDDSTIVSLTLIPADYAVSDSDVNGESTDEGTFYKMTEDVDFYSVMEAELEAVNFDMKDSQMLQSKLVLPGSTAEWTWVITPKTVGGQALTVTLSAPVRVAGYEEDIAWVVYSQSAPISVTEPINFGDFLQRTETIVGIIVAISGAILGWFGYRQKRKKRASIHLP